MFIYLGFIPRFKIALIVASAVGGFVCVCVSVSRNGDELGRASHSKWPQFVFVRPKPPWPSDRFDGWPSTGPFMARQPKVYILVNELSSALLYSSNSNREDRQ